MATSKNGNKTMSVTSIKDLAVSANGSLVELPPFSSDVKFVARLRRPSMLQLVKRGKIPNVLLNEASKMFASGPSSLVGAKDVSGKGFDDLFSLMEVICEAAFVEPTYAELKEAGIELTDDQLMFLFSYTQNGVNALKSFRVEQ